jgi:outer membrane protein OmpA-like peptidoglycan-associated protein
MSFCTNCGTRSPEGSGFCGNCGGPLAENRSTVANPSPPPVVRRSVPEPAVPASVSQPSKAATPWGKILAIVIVLGVVLFGSVIGGLVYVGYRVKKKADAVLHRSDSGDSAVSSGDDNSESKPRRSNNESTSPGSSNSQDNPLAGILGAIGGGNGGQSTPMGNMAKGILEDVGMKNPDMPPDLVRTIPYSAVTNPLPCPTGAQINVAQLASGRIQLKPGTVLTTSWSVPAGDLESTQEIRLISPDNLDFQGSQATRPRIGDTGSLGYADLPSRVCGKDIAGGETFSTGWVFNTENKAPGLYPGVSRILLPIQKLQTVKATGNLPMVFGYYDYMDALTEWELLAWKGTLTRVEPGDVAFPLIINDQPVDVPTIHLQGSMKVIESGGRFGSRDQHADAYILDDPNTPVVLSWMFGEDFKQEDAFRVRYVKVTYPSADKPTIEQQLAKQKKAITYGIYFDFNKDVIKPESEPVLKEIAQAMSDKPDWKLTIVGYTDNIGGDKYNLELSQRRSASVKRALVERYHEDAGRLSTAGYGDSGPIDTNETLEGRARNRRVEITLE